MNSFCRHYPEGGRWKNDTCDVGVEMDTVRDDSARPSRWPCSDPSLAARCAKHEPYTAEEIAEDHRQVAIALKAMLGVMEGTSDVCPHCNAHIEGLDQVGRCVYARPCGCRQYQGTVPDAWKDKP